MSLPAILRPIVLIIGFICLLRPPNAAAQCVCLGDMNADLFRDFNDIPPFTQCLLSGGGPACACADTNEDTLVNGGDISSFVNFLVTTPFCSTVTTPPFEPGPLETPPASPCNEGPSCGARPDAACIHTTYLFSGEFYHSAVDLRIKGRGLDFVWARKYRSRFGPNTAQGNGWDFSYNIYIEQVGQNRLLYDGNSRQDLYLLQANGKWARDEFFRELEQNGDGTYTLTFADTGKWNFRPLAVPIAPGRISSIVDRNGNSLSFAYYLSGPNQGKLQKVFDTLNREINIAYDAGGRISTVTDFTGRQVVYTYSADGDLLTVRSPVVTGTPNGNDFPGGKITTYTYSSGFTNPALNHNLLTITDPKGQTYLTNTYHSTTNPLDPNFDRLTRQVWGNPNDIIDVVYVPQAPGPGNNNAVMRAIVNDRGTSTPPATTPSGSNVHEYFYDAMNRLVMARDFTGRAIPHQPTTDTLNRPTNKLRPSDPDFFETRWQHNADAMVTQTIHPNGNTTVNTYELDLNPNAPRRSRGNLRQVTRNPGPLGGDQASITESFTYETGFGGCGCGTNFVKTHTNARGFVTMHTYDIHGNRLHTDHRPGGGVEDWTYNNFGQVTSHTLPANGPPANHRRVDSYTYYNAGPQNGYLQSEVVDAGGFNLTTQYTYDAVGNVLTRTDPRGSVSSSTYNQLDQVVRELSRPGGGGVPIETRTWYDANDNVVRTDVQNLDENGAPQANTYLSTISEYEILNRVTRTCQEKGSANLTNTDLTCAAMSDGQRITTEYDYDANRNQIRVRTPLAVMMGPGAQPNNTIDTEYDERDLVFKSIRSKMDASLKYTTQTDYDGNGNVRATRAGIDEVPPADVRTTVSTYDGFNRLKTSVDPMGNEGRYSYDANGNQTSSMVRGELMDTNAASPPGTPSPGNVRLSETTFTYDAMDRMVQSNTAHFDTQTQTAIGDGFSTSSTTYANNSQVVSTTDDRGNVTTTAYDTANRRSVVTDARGNTTTYNYDPNSNVTSTVEMELSDLGNPPQTFTTSFVYDSLDRQTSMTDSGLNTTQSRYDSRSNATMSIDARLNKTQMSYDSVDRPVQTIRDMNGDAQFNASPGHPDIATPRAWDNNSNPLSRADDNSNATADTYNARNEPTQTDYADACTLDSRIYDVHGNLTSETNANGTTVNFTYDLLNRVTQKSITPGAGVAADTLCETFAYDGLSRRVSAANRNFSCGNPNPPTIGSTVMRTYDSLGNVLTESQIAPGLGVPQFVASTYDGMGNRLTLVYAGRTVSMSYDALNRLKTVGDNTIPIIAFYDYIGPARVQRRTYRLGDPTETLCDYEYDVARRITRTRHHNSGGDIDDRAYGWDGNYNKTARIITPVSGAGSFQSDFIYDAANRLVSSATLDILGGGLNDRQTTYGLDGVGNRASVSGTNALDPGGYTMTLGCEPADHEMNQYTLTPAGGRNYDRNGNLLNWNMGMPGAGTAVYDYANRMVSSTVGGVTTLYRYDALGRRIAKCVGVCGPGPGPGTTRFIYDGWREVQALGGGAQPATFVYGNYIDEVLTMRRGAVDYYYHTDDLYNVVALTGSMGGLVERYEYDDYGRPVDVLTLAPVPGNPSMSSINNPHLFNGRRYDVETGWYYYRTRYLDPRAGRFTTRDTIGIWGDPAEMGNASAFAASNPATYVDPFGTSSEENCKPILQRWTSAVRVAHGLTGPKAVVAVATAPGAPIKEAIGQALQLAGQAMDLLEYDADPESICYELADCYKNAGYVQGGFEVRNALGNAIAICWWAGDWKGYSAYGLRMAFRLASWPALPEFRRAPARQPAQPSVPFHSPPPPPAPDREPYPGETAARVKLFQSIPRWEQEVDAATTEAELRVLGDRANTLPDPARVIVLYRIKLKQASMAQKR